MADTQSLNPTDPPALGQYELLGRLGEGAQGVVYLARDCDGGQVAIKLLRTHLSQSAASRTRFLREVEAAKRVPSFCTAKLLDADLAESQPYIVSEYIPGSSLAAVLRSDGPRRGAALERIAINTATALAGIHQAGVVHRDFKAANVLLGPDGPVVIDFGIAKALDAADAAGTGGDLTVPGQMAGTPGYMAPEQFEAGQTGPEADVFAWGATIAYAATGSLPFGSEPISNVIYRIFNEPPRLDGLTGPLRDLVAACLRPEPDTRPTARDIVDTLLGRQSQDGDTPRIDDTPRMDEAPSWDGTPMSTGTGGTGTGGTGTGFGTETGTGTGAGALRGDPIRSVQMRQPSPGFNFDEHDKAPTPPRGQSRRPKWTMIAAAAAVVVLAGAGAAGYSVWGKSPGGGNTRPLANSTTVAHTKQATAPPAKQGGKPARPGGAAPGNADGSGTGGGAGTGGGTAAGTVSTGQSASGGGQQSSGGQQASSSAQGTSASKPAAAQTPSSKPNPYTAGAVCGSGYSVIDSHALTGGTIYLLYSSSSGKNCVATLRSRVSGTISMSATLSVQGGSSKSDSGGYAYYAGPVSLTAKSTCVEWGGSIGSSSWKSSWSHCG